MNPQPTERQLKAITRFCEWLNLINEDAPNPPYKPENFISEEFSEFEVVTSFKADWYDVDVLYIYNGDDGGGTVLTVWYRDDEPEHATNLFDLQLGQWLSEGRLIFTKGYFTPDPER